MKGLFALLIVAGLINGCSVQLTKPVKLVESEFSSKGLVFGTIAFDNVFHRFSSANMVLRRIGSEQQVVFSAREYQPDHATDKVLRQLFLRQVPPGTYELVEMGSYAYPNTYTLTLKKPIRFSLAAGDVMYLGRLLFERTWGENMFGMSIPSEPDASFSDDAELDYSIASGYYPNMPSIESIRFAPWLINDREYEMETRRDTYVPPTIPTPLE